MQIPRFPSEPQERAGSTFLGGMEQKYVFKLNCLVGLVAVSSQLKAAVPQRVLLGCYPPVKNLEEFYRGNLTSLRKKTYKQ